MQRRIYGWLLATCLTSPLGLAQEILTEAELLAPLDARSAAARALVDVLAAPRERLLAARQLPNPQLGIIREDTGDAGVESTWSVRWTPPVAARRLAVAAASAALDGAEERVAGRRLELRAEVRAAYADWALAAERRELFAAHAERVSELAARLAHRAEAGEASGLAAGRLSLAAVSAQVERERATAELEGRRARIREWRELGERAVPRLPELPEIPAELTPEGRPDLAARRGELAASRLDERRSRRFLAAPELEVGWKRLEDGPQSFDGPVLGVAWSLPVGERGQARRAAAATELEAATARLELLERRAVAELAGARAAYDGLRRAVAATSPEGTDRLAVAATAAYELGEATVTDLLDTLRAVRDARLEHLDLYAAALAAHRQLELAAGRPLDPGASP